MSRRNKLNDVADTLRTVGTLAKQGSEGDHASLDTLLRLRDWLNQPTTPAPVVYHDPDQHGDDPTVTREYGAAFVKYVGSRGEHVPSILREGTEYQAITAGSDPGGGYTLPADARAAILARQPAISEILGLVTRIPTTSDEVSWARVQPHGSSASIFTSAFVGSMVGEIPGATDGENEPTFGRVIEQIKKGRAKARISMDLLQDNPALLPFLLRNGGDNLALLMEQQLVNGDGIGKNIKGVLQYAGSGVDEIASVDVSGSTADTISNTTANAGSAPKILDWVYAVPAQYRRMTSFRVVMNSQSEKKIRKLVDANSRFMWTADGAFGSPNEGLLGYPKAISEFMPDDGTDGRKPLLAGDFSEVLLALNGDIRAQVLQERYADTDEVGLILRQRFGVVVSNPDAFRIGAV